MIFLHFADFLGFEFVRVFVGFELKWAQQFARLLGAAGRRHLRLPSLPGPARGPAWLALRPPLPPAPGAAALLCVRGERPSCRRWVSWPCWACADRAPPADAALPPTPTSSPAAPRRRRRASPTVVRPAPPRCPLLSQQVVSPLFRSRHFVIDAEFVIRTRVA